MRSLYDIGSKSFSPAIMVKGKANEAIRNALAVYFKTGSSRVKIVSGYSSRNKISDAEQQLKEGIRQNNKSFQIRFALSSFYLATNRPDQAISTLQECLGLKSDPANPDILQTKNSLAGIYLGRQEIDKAKKYVEEVVKESPKDVDANFAKGTIHLLKGEGGQAVSAFRIVVNERPQFILGYISLADAHVLNKEPNLAFDILRNALKTYPGSRDIIRAMARLYAMRKDFQNAEAQYRNILDTNPNDMEVRACTVTSGATAVKAAGTVHTDFERGFIKAETVAYDDLVKCGSIAAAREKGLYRMEGREYVVQDGDVMLFKFNVT